MTVPARIIDTENRTPLELQGYTSTIVNGQPVAAEIATNGQPFLIPFSVEGLSGPVGLTFPSAATTEVTPLVRVWVSFRGFNLARLQGHISTAAATGQQFAVKWDNAGTPTWLGQDLTGADGPVLTVDSTGDLRGPEVQLSAAVLALDEVLIGLYGIAP